jgi:hypothetical protein
VADLDFFLASAKLSSRLGYQGRFPPSSGRNDHGVDARLEIIRKMFQFLGAIHKGFAPDYLTKYKRRFHKS